MSSGKPKNPRSPSLPLSLDPAEVVRYTGPLWRIHTTAGAHPAAWNDLRRYGPLPAFRWDPHPVPTQLHPLVGVSYTAQDYATVFAEVFQRDRLITLTSDKTLSGWTPSRPLELLDILNSDWAVRNHASASLPQSPKKTCRAWANAIREQFGTSIDGLLVPSTMTGGAVVVLYSRAGTAFPVAPQFSRSLDHSDVMTMAANTARKLKWQIVVAS
ncbi:RES family NAD+ phosphorylase [Arthrobacter castelli]|uniref:RES family NAD+ phosphorylase n=1 Tax=Arthrobacter castelli TaxID=271431 RepID=UPI00047E7A79|nr:RES family NAD+ phosphorylase [Arthrobacter castelli]